MWVLSIAFRPEMRLAGTHAANNGWHLSAVLLRRASAPPNGRAPLCFGSPAAGEEPRHNAWTGAVEGCPSPTRASVRYRLGTGTPPGVLPLRRALSIGWRHELWWRSVAEHSVRDSGWPHPARNRCRTPVAQLAECYRPDWGSLAQDRASWSAQSSARMAHFRMAHLVGSSPAVWPTSAVATPRNCKAHPRRLAARSPYASREERSCIEKPVMFLRAYSSYLNTSTFKHIARL